MPVTRRASGNIPPCCFVKLNSTNGTVLVAGAGEAIYGISQPMSRNPPFTGLDDGYCAIDGEELEIFVFPDKEIKLLIGVGGCAPGNRLKSDATGGGIVAVTTEEIGAIALVNGNAGDYADVDMLSPGVF